jgi:NAD(P)-dependent dehydrogenase (short-subunit alcohol dehydrogenase family)
MEKVKQGIGAEDRNVVFLRADVTKPEDWQTAVDAAVSHFGKLDVLSHTAGILDTVYYDTITYENWKKVMDVNAWSHMLAYRAVVPEMIKAGGGSIIIVSSMGAINSGGGLTAYSASKGACQSLSVAASVELAQYNIRTNCILPGTIETPMLAAAFPDEQAYKDMIDAQLFKRLGRPQDIACYALYLASDESKFTNGTSLMMDGGLHNFPGTRPKEQ